MAYATVKEHVMTESPEQAPATATSDGQVKHVTCARLLSKETNAISANETGQGNTATGVIPDIPDPTATPVQTGFYRKTIYTACYAEGANPDFTEHTANNAETVQNTTHWQPAETTTGTKPTYTKQTPARLKETPVPINTTVPRTTAKEHAQLETQRQDNYVNTTKTAFPEHASSNSAV